MAKTTDNLDYLDSADDLKTLDKANENPSFFEHRGNRKTFLVVFNFILLAIGSLLILSPLWWMFATSLKTMAEVMSFPPSFWPENWLFSNYIKTWEAAPFTRYTINTLTITIIVVIGNVLSNSFIAYGFAKIPFRGKNILFAIVLATMMIPGFVTLIPQYVLFANLGWVNTYYPLIVPSFFGSAFNIFLLRQFYMTIPTELIEAAKMEGANHFYIWWKIGLPLTKPAIATVAIFSFNGAWNDFLGPLLYLNDEKLYTLQIGLQVFKGQLSTQWNYLMAGSLLVLLPVILIFFIFQKYFIQGINLQSGGK
ncbi:carbohydrate ABC transporter permease [Planococcus shenhongbingii]|uniref:Carbohydrate ABC transporter permease n=1 Tax=Planococcus shenhongbingii TaxID=3058398 RepID=A0ABT8NB42_9BACL|nr:MULTISPECIES: carbohydrate ABC transporter permease [unclassified Planococcus (in: firmicutes)]MDN7245113.1 carbohydrate ABC transporter permease [Planococcus sp. N017]WKA58209.1 carbohydrate ABC transporter permease [Planococcus sp. N016]